MQISHVFCQGGANSGKKTIFGKSASPDIQDSVYAERIF